MIGLNGMSPALSIAIPAFNEELNVRRMFEHARSCVEAGVGKSVEWVLVDDGSTDRTGARMDELASEHELVSKVVHPHRRGLGAAIWTGVSASKGELFTWLPADGQIDPSVISSMMARMETADLVMLMREERERETSRQALTLGMYGLFRLLLGFDPYGFSGVFLTRREHLTSVALASNSGIQNYAVVINAMRKQQRLARVTTVVGPRLSGRSKVTNVSTTLRVMTDILRLRVKMSR
jgi:glycosyltransferase involved in cell wall biosynthesis